MKNALLYYYNINVSDIYRIDNNYYFYQNERKYSFNVTLFTEEELVQKNYLAINLYNRGITTDQFVFNNNGKIITVINNQGYVLTINVNNDRNNTTLESIIQFSNNSLDINSYTSNSPIEWKKLWREKIDYLEYQMSQLGRGNLRIRESFNYFVGLAENAITLLELDNGYSKYSLGHRKQSDTFNNFSDPTTYIIDIRVRDAAEFFKEMMLKESFDIEQVLYYVNISDLNANEELMFFARVLFPTYYFDAINDVIIDNKDEKKLDSIVKCIPNIENSIRKIYYNINNLPRIEWLGK